MSSRMFSIKNCGNCKHRKLYKQIWTICKISGILSKIFEQRHDLKQISETNNVCRVLLQKCNTSKIRVAAFTDKLN